MGSINKLHNNTLYLDFRYRGKRCKEYTKLKDSPPNRRRLDKIVERIEAEIILGTFDYGAYFPKSKRVTKFAKDLERVELIQSGMPSFGQFAETWYREKQVEWRDSHADTVRNTLDVYLIPAFGDRPLASISKSDLLDFRVEVTKRKGRKAATISAERVNHIMTPLRMILNEAADRHSFITPFQGIKSLKVPKTDVQPFNFAEVKLILDTVRADFKSYYTVRILSGMRTSEIDGLQWKYIDFDRREILIRESWVRGKLGPTKTEGSSRSIYMSEPVYQALKIQQEVTGKDQFVFCTDSGSPLDQNNVTKRVWYPLLRLLKLTKRRPYQTRHTAATLWLAAGENPEWIARQMGHTTTEMLFRVYSRYVPNLTRQDGSAFEAILNQTLDISSSQEGEQ